MEQRKQEAKEQAETTIDRGHFQMVAITLQGLEEVLARELLNIGANDVRPVKRAVEFTADLDLVYKANLRIRTAIRIIKPLHHFRAANEDALYDGIKAMDWSKIFDQDKTFLIRAAVSGDNFTHSQYVSLKCKDAIVDQFRERTGTRPDVDTDDPDIVIHIKIFRDQVSVSLDSSGVPLHRRGYRQREAQAPLNECLAAGMLLIAGYEGKTDFIDAMCGSGTLCIEAALIAHRIAPGLLRDKFAFMHWKDYDESLFEVIREATANRVQEQPIKITGYDIDRASVEMARKAVSHLSLEDLVSFEEGDFFEIDPPAPPAILVMNPPYGERMQVAAIENMYKQIGDRLKKNYAGYQAWILSGNIDAMKNVGLRTFHTHHLLNGTIECRFSGYRMYTGAKYPQA